MSKAIIHLFFNNSCMNCSTDNHSRSKGMTNVGYEMVPAISIILIGKKCIKLFLQSELGNISSLIE